MQHSTHLLLPGGERFKLLLEQLLLCTPTHELKLRAKHLRVRHGNRMHQQTKAIFLHLFDLLPQVALRREERRTPVLCGWPSIVVVRDLQVEGDQLRIGVRQPVRSDGAAVAATDNLDSLLHLPVAALVLSMLDNAL